MKKIDFTEIEPAGFECKDRCNLKQKIVVMHCFTFADVRCSQEPELRESDRPRKLSVKGTEDRGRLQALLESVGSHRVVIVRFLLRGNTLGEAFRAKDTVPSGNISIIFSSIPWPSWPEATYMLKQQLQRQQSTDSA